MSPTTTERLTVGDGDVCSAVLQELLDVVWPTACAGCEDPLAVGRDRICAACRATAPAGLWPLPVEGLDKAWGWSPYDHVLGAALRRGKYQPDPRTLAVLAGLLAGAATSVVGTSTHVVPVPRSWQDLLRTGLEPTGVLALAVAQASSQSVSWLLRRRHGPSQAAQPTDKRRANVSGAFHCVARIPGARVLLVDDVVTTGATARACSSALRAGGAAQVVLLAACSPRL